MYYVNKEIHAKKYCAVHSEHRIDKLNAKSIWKENLKVFITELFIEKTVSFWDPVKTFRGSTRGVL